LSPIGKTGIFELARCKHACAHALPHATLRWMPKTVQIRDIDDEVYAGLVRRAAEVRLSVPELLRAEAARIAARPSVDEWLARTARRSSSVDRAEIAAALDEQRGPWPDARR
jgi:uncharacterized membrane protein